MTRNGERLSIICAIILIGIFVVALVLALTMFTVDKLHDWALPQLPPKMASTVENHLHGVLLTVMTDWIYSHSFRTDRCMSKWIANCILENAKYSIPLTLAIFTRESNFDVTAISSAGAYGIAQIHKVHFKELKEAGIISSPRDLFNPCTATKAFNFVFGQKLKRAGGNVDQAVVYYLGADERSKVGKAYLKDVLTLRCQFELEFAERIFSLCDYSLP